MLRFSEIGARLKAYRVGKGLAAHEVAEQLGISRAAIYRLEKGDLIKIETLERLSALLDVSLPSLMGVGVEYYSNALAFFERMRLLEEHATHVLGNFSPFSFLLLSDDYMGRLRDMLAEAIPDKAPDRAERIDYIRRVLKTLDERRVVARRRRTPIVSVVSAQDIERFVHVGLIGRFNLTARVRKERLEAAYAEVEYLAALMERAPIGVQIGVVDAMPPSQTFQVFERVQEESTVTLSPYRLGDQPNISSGIAMVTSAPEAVRLFADTISAQWSIAHKGESGARRLRAILARAKGATGPHDGPR